MNTSILTAVSTLMMPTKTERACTVLSGRDITFDPSTALSIDDAYKGQSRAD